MKRIFAVVLFVGTTVFLWPDDAVPAPDTGAQRALARQWLLSQVQPDGLWPVRYEVYRLPTSLVCLGAILANDGALREDVLPVAEGVCRALDDERFGLYMRDPRAVMYTQTVGLWVCSQLAQFTGDEAHRDRVRRCLEAMQAYRRQPGDWAYPFDPGETGPTGFLTPGIEAARAAGLDGDVAWLEKMYRRYLVPMYDPVSNHIRYRAEPAFDYQGRGTDVVGWLAATRLGWEEMSESADRLADVLFTRPRWIPMGDPSEVDSVVGLNNFYFWALGACGARRSADPRIRDWLFILQSVVAANQNDDGSWEPCDIWMTAGDRHYATAMNYWVLAPAVNMDSERR